ncbi:hypothetical protein A6X20_02825 [Bradyrhizobium elkanii]|nr:hypothetical protein A6X20_02825 [Bradyrhizobium elkanii]ODM84107.1 hypothetical protein A6452_15065 [Bradyrhizobium elkanii]
MPQGTDRPITSRYRNDSQADRGIKVRRFAASAHSPEATRMTLMNWDIDRLFITIANGLARLN